jgi:hypothetical protein
MGINVSTSMGFQNREFSESMAKSTLRTNAVNTEKAEEASSGTVFAAKNYPASSAFVIFSTSAQISLHNSLRETMNYLRSRAEDKKKKYVLGELWDDFTSNKDGDEEDSYTGELCDYVIDKNLKNIFAA